MYLRVYIYRMKKEMDKLVELTLAVMVVHLINVILQHKVASQIQFKIFGIWYIKKTLE